MQDFTKKIEVNKFMLTFSAIAWDIPLSDYDNVLLQALINTYDGFSRQFSLCRGGIYKQVHIGKILILENKQRLLMPTLVSVEIEFRQEYYEDLAKDAQITELDKLESALKSQLSNFSYYYRTSLDEGDIAKISLVKIERG